MVKLAQNKVSESSWTLPLVSLYTCIIWMLCGGIQEQWWLQLGCLSFTTYLMVQLNNRNVLIRIYSRMVGSSFLLLSSCACFLFSSVLGSVTSLFFVSTYLLLFACYLDETAVGKVYYAFLSLGLASWGDIHALYYFPVFWILGGIYLSILSWPTFFASILGIITPYWFAFCWYTYQHDIQTLITHLEQLCVFYTPFDFSVITQGRLLTFAFLLLLMLIGTIHCLRKSYVDNIRTRMFYNIFIWVDIITALFIVLQPQHYDFLIRIMIINTAPLAAHFLALTSTKVTNVIFYLLGGLTFCLTAYNIWTTSSLF